MILVVKGNAVLGHELVIFGQGNIVFALDAVGDCLVRPVDGVALWNKEIWYILLLLVPIKILATSITIGSGGSGGIFAPSLFMGAMAGGAFGFGVNALFPEYTAQPGAYAIVGMGAVVAGTTHAPIQAFLILFELTQDYLIIGPLMICCVISTVVAQKIKKESRQQVNLFIQK